MCAIPCRFHKIFHCEFDPQFKNQMSSANKAKRYGYKISLSFLDCFARYDGRGRQRDGANESFASRGVLVVGRETGTPW
jgi:hypothetical protein